MTTSTISDPTQTHQKTVGNLIVVAAPSGAGKTSLVYGILDSIPEIQLSTSHTSRAMREGEIDGQQYHFVDVETFRQMISEDAFIEHAEVFGNLYGTSKASLTAPLAEGHDVLLEIDWQGARLIKQAFPDAISVFILPPSIEDLRKRLEERGKDSAETIDKRMHEARDQIQHYNEFDYLVVNDDFNRALEELRGLILASRLRLNAQQKRHQQLIESLITSTV